MTRERDAEPSNWLLVKRFADAREALRAYEQTRDLILGDNLAASVFRLTIAADSFVATLAECPPAPPERRKLEKILRAGDSAELPGEVIEHLRGRRQKFNALPIEFLERRNQGG